MNKISKWLLTIFSVGVLIAVFSGVIAFLGFCVALVMGGENATHICVFIHKEYFPVLIRICSIAVGCGLVGMYLTKKKALVVDTAEKQK